MNELIMENQILIKSDEAVQIGSCTVRSYWVPTVDRLIGMVNTKGNEIM
jgi:hypothetical protein